MEDPAILIPSPQNSKKRLFGSSSGSSNSSFFDSDVVEIPRPSTWHSNSSKKKNPIVGHEIIVVDDEDPDDAVIIGVKFAADGKGKKPMLHYPAEHEVINLDEYSSSKANAVVNFSPYLSFIGEAIIPGIPASVAFEKHAQPTSSTSLYGAQTYSNVCSSKGPTALQTEISLSRYPLYKSKHSSSRLQPSSCLGQTSVSQPLPPEISLPSTDEQDNFSENPILKKLELFKKFDTLEDHSGHLYEMIKEPLKPSKGWVNKIADEWRMLEKDLPDTIFVRVYEARMDLLRAVIIGADGTPYHDGLFFFDVHFDTSYPTKPPSVTYHAHGLRMNPNLYNCGKVCLSLLGTWPGNGDEMWRPLKSNMLQVLVSIQGLILNEDPYYNEPAFAVLKNNPRYAKKSKDYSENIYLLSLKTMLYTLQNPPKYFEDLVYGHFYQRAHDILAACRAYLDGVKVGSFVKGKTQSVHCKTKKNTCSQLLQTSLPGQVKSLVKAFTKIGVRDCEKYLI